MTDVVLPYGHEPNAKLSIFKGELLRYTLRSWAKNAENIGRIIIIGDPPKWVNNVIVEPYPDVMANKNQNMFLKLFHAIHKFRLEKVFLYGSDDHILLGPVDFDNHPLYYRRNKLRPDPRYTITDPDLRAKVKPRWYEKMLYETRRTLMKHGYPIIEFEGHVNRPLDPKYADEVWKMVFDDPEHIPVFFGEIGSLFSNVKLKHEKIPNIAYRRDIKLVSVEGKEDLMSQIDDTHDYISCADEALESPYFVEFLNTNFPERCVFEKG